MYIRICICIFVIDFAYWINLEKKKNVFDYDI